MPTTFAADQILTVGQLNAALVQATNDAVARQTPISPAMAGVVGLPTVIQAWNVLSASGIITQTPQVAFGPVGNAFPTFGCIVQQTTTISQNVREFALAVGLESNIGHGGITGGIRADKVAIYGGIEGFANSADIWAINTVTRLVSGFPSDSNALGYELDFNNNASNRGTGIGTAGLGFPFASGLVITGGGGSAGAPLSATSGLHIGGGAATGNGFSGTWERGIVIDTAVQAAIFDWSHATTAFVSYGTHSFGIDLAPMGLFNGGHAIRLANSQDLASNNADNSATVPLIYLDGNNNVTIGGGGSRIFYNAQNMVPFS